MKHHGEQGRGGKGDTRPLLHSWQHGEGRGCSFFFRLVSSKIPPKLLVWCRIHFDFLSEISINSFMLLLNNTASQRQLQLTAG